MDKAFSEQQEALLIGAAKLRDALGGRRPRRGEPADMILTAARLLERERSEQTRSARRSEHNRNHYESHRESVLDAQHAYRRRKRDLRRARLLVERAGTMGPPPPRRKRATDEPPREVGEGAESR